MPRAYVSRGWPFILQEKKSPSEIVENSGKTSKIRLQEKKSGPEILRFSRNLQKRRKRMKKLPFLEQPENRCTKKEHGRQRGEEWKPLKTIGETKARHDFPVSPAAGPDDQHGNLTV